MELSKEIVELLNEHWPGKNIYEMSLEELEKMRVEVVELREEYTLLEMAMKTLGNAAYGASANEWFYFYNLALAADITGECRVLTKFMWDRLELFFHEDIWERKDLWERFDFALDESKHDWYREQPVSIYSDTDSIEKTSVLSIKDNKNIQNKISIEDLYNNCLKRFGQFTITESNKEIVECDQQVLNYTNDNKVDYVPIKYIIRHKVSKPRFKIKSKSGKEIIVTGDHSCIVFRNGKKMSIKAKDINQNIDKILSINNYNSYIIEEIESIEQLDNFNDEYVYDIEVDDNTHTFIANDILVHNSVYTTYGTLFQAMTPESQAKYDTDRKKTEFILKFNKEFLDKQNFEWLNEMYTPRHAKNIHNFELETISAAGIYLKKKKYLKALSFSKGKFFDNPKISGTGIEIVKSTTPKLCREILTDMTRSLVFETGQMSKDEYILYFNQKLADWKRKFYSVPVEDISQSIGIGAYKKYVLNDTTSLEFAPKAPTSVKCIARYNYLAHQNGQDNLKMISGKVKYYNIRVGRTTDYFGFPAGELPSFAPPIDYPTQWQKTVIDPLNRFLEVMDLPSVNIGGTIQYNLFD